MDVIDPFFLDQVDTQWLVSFYFSQLLQRLGGDVPATAPDLKLLEKGDVISVEPCFAQDLLVQERLGKSMDIRKCTS